MVSNMAAAHRRVSIIVLSLSSLMLVGSCTKPTVSHKVGGNTSTAKATTATIRTDSISATSSAHRVRSEQAFLNDPEEFQFVIVTDRTGGHRPGVFESAVEKVNLMRPEFVMSVGDLIEGYTEDTTRIREEWDEFESFIGKLEMPFHYVAGNHDLTNAVMMEEWSRRFGPVDYSFVYRDVLFLCLRTHFFEKGEELTSAKEKQWSFVEQQLSENEDVRWTLVFFHHPYWDRKEDWARLRPLFGERPVSFFAGHYHTYAKHQVDSANCYVLATTGGGTRLRGPLLGEFDHFAWITMTRKGPVMANLMLDGISGDEPRGQLTAESRRSISSALRPDKVQVRRTGKPLGKAQWDTLEVRVTNDADLPMHVAIMATGADSFFLAPATVKQTIEPNSVLVKRIRVGTGKPIAWDRLSAGFRFDYHLSFEAPEEKQIRASLEGSRNHFYEADYTIATATPKSIDGELDDWKSLPIVADVPVFGFRQETWKGTEDASFRFGVEADEHFLYVAVEAVDDIATMSPDSAYPWFQDGIELRVDARPDPQRSQGRGKNEGHDFLLLAVCPREIASQSILVHADSLPSGVQVASLRKGNKIYAEFAIPAAYLDSAQNAGKPGPPWRAVRLNVSQGDFDGAPFNRHDAVQLLWKPDWRSDANYEGSGTFVRK